MTLAYKASALGQFQPECARQPEGLRQLWVVGATNLEIWAGMFADISPGTETEHFGLKKKIPADI